jgi:hypothetical protein
LKQACMCALIGYRSLSAEINAHSFETSALTGVHVSSPFEDVAREYLLRPKKPVTEYSTNNVVLGEERKNNGGGGRGKRAGAGGEESSCPC